MELTENNPKNNNKRRRRIIAVIAYALVILIIILGTVFAWQRIFAEQPATQDEGVMSYHFMMLGRSQDDAYWATVRRGAINSASMLDTALQYQSIDEDSEQSAEDYFKMAVKAGVDGIIVYVYDEEECENLIAMATSHGIPVVTIDTDAPYSTRTVHIGVDNYRFGQTLGAVVEQAIGGSGNISLIVGADEGYMMNSSQNERLKGFNEYLSANDKILLIREQYSTSGIVSAAQIARDILNTYYSVDAIVCTTPTEALGAAQAVMERDSDERDIKIICLEENVQILDYIETGVIDSAVISNPYQIGYLSVGVLVHYIQSGVIEDVHITQYVINKDNMEAYTKYYLETQE